MTKFFDRSRSVSVSKITPDGWWIENTKEHVVKGTALGPEFTENIYTPSKDGMIARYNKDSDSWSPEIKNMTWEKYWNQNCQMFVIGKPDGDYPEWAIKEEPPQHNPDKQTALHTKESGWRVYPIKIGEPYYDQWGKQLVVSDFNFDLPDNHSWDKPPVADKGHVIKLTNGKWQQLIDHRNKMAFAKDRDKPELEDYIVEKLGELPNTHTLIERGEFDSWVNDDKGWQYDIERHRPAKAADEKQWRDTQLKRVLDRIDQYEKDQHYPEELRTSPITNKNDFTKLLQDRKTLSDYPESAGYPFEKRPILSGLSD